MRSRVLLSLMIAAAVALSPHAGATAVTDDGGTAPMAVLSSFTAETLGATIVGGTRTVTVHNFATTEIGASVDLEPAPCDCTISRIAASHGTVSGSVWTIAALAGAHTATLTISYGPMASEPVAIRAHLRANPGTGHSPAGDVLPGAIVRSRHIAL